MWFPFILKNLVVCSLPAIPDEYLYLPWDRNLICRNNIIYRDKLHLYNMQLLEVKLSIAQLCPTLCNPMDCSPPGSSVHGNSPSKNTGVGCYAFIQGIFLTQGSNLWSPGKGNGYPLQYSCLKNPHRQRSLVGYSPCSHKELDTTEQLTLCNLSVQFSSVAQSCLTFCDPMDCSIPGLPVLHQLPEFTQTHVHWVGDAIQPSHPLSSPSPPTFYLSQHQGLFQWVSSSHQVA